LYKPTSVVFHLKVIVVTILCMAPIIYGLKQPLCSELTFQYIILVLLFIEAWLLLAFKLIRYKDGKNRKEVTRNILIRFVLLYISCMLSAAIILFIYQVVMYSVHGYIFLSFMSSIIRNSLVYLNNMNFPILIILAGLLYGNGNTH